MTETIKKPVPALVQKELEAKGKNEKPKVTDENPCANIPKDKMVPKEERDKMFFEEMQAYKKEVVKKWDKPVEVSSATTKTLNEMERLYGETPKQETPRCKDNPLHTYSKNISNEDYQSIRKDIEAVKEFQRKANLPTYTFEGILEEMSTLHTKKNTDYGDVWHRELKEFGILPAIIRLWEKVERLKATNKNQQTLVEDESFDDTLIDIANYAVMTLVELRNNRKK